MNKLLLSVLVFLFPTFIWAACLSYDEQAEHRDFIQKMMSSPQVCNADNECVIEYLGCPFGCGTPLAKNNVTLIKNEVSQYHQSSCSACMYKCKPINSVKCVNNECVAD